ncbi:MAG: threonylcarbamoyl-AMP synthase [Candidatus Aminicenantes bacterium RBG_16_63_16]|nr:MAG: threonylcarbamoyl-AMP synthase [Candidatus Aminicenantes bacterium RBG_16_63_16]
MRARIIRIDPQIVGTDVIEDMAGTLKRGGVIVYPTDTYYGLGADCSNRNALSRIFEIKGRPFSKALLVLVSDVDVACRLAAEIPPAFERLAAAFWPGPLTFVLKAAPGLPDELVGPDRTIGIRLPAPAWLRELVRTAGFPVVATSANISGEKEIDSGEAAVWQFEDKVDLIIDGGKTAGGRPSTVVDLTSGRPVLRREGAIPRAMIQKVVEILTS